MIYELDMGEFESTVEIRTFGESKRIYITDCESYDTVIVPNDKLENFIETLVSIKKDFESQEEL